MITANKTRRVLLIAGDIIGPNMIGPGIRYWEFARVLSDYFTVTLAISPFANQNVAVPVPPFPATITLCQNNADLYALADQTDVVVTVGHILLAHPQLLKTNKPLVLDIYVPSLLERLHVRAGTTPTHQHLFLNEKERTAHNTQLRVADFIVCASEKQRDYWMGLLTALGRVNPYTHNHDKTLRRLIDVVPFGLPREKAIHTQAVLKGVHPGIGPNDDVLIWTGGLWEWLDAPTLIKAMPLVLRQRPNLKLFFMGVKRPNDKTRMDYLDCILALAQEMGLKDTHIFFNDWVPYQQRQNYLLEADLGVSLHSDHLENRFSFRTRFLDHLWTGLPLVATAGDIMSEELVKLGLAQTVKPGDITGVAQAIEEMLAKKEIRQNYLTNIEQVIELYQWETVTQPLVEYCANPYFAPDKAYLKTIPLFELGPTPYWKLPQKVWRALKNNGLAGLSWQIRRYITWKQNKSAVD